MMTGFTATGLFAQQVPAEIQPAPLLAPSQAAAGLRSNPEALTPGEKAELALQRTFGPWAIGRRTLWAAIDQWRDHPHEWPSGGEGFGMRVGSRMGRLAVRNAIRLGTDVALGIDPRYDPCICDGFLARAGHAWKRVLVSRSDSGSEMPAYSNFTAGFASPWVTYAWYPDRLNTTGNKLQNGAMHLGWRGVSNMFREFWPEMRRGLRLKREQN